MKNKLSDLTDHLFAQIERLADEDMTPDRIDTEVKRAGALVSLADRITATGDLQLRAAKLYAEHGTGVLNMLPAIGRGGTGGGDAQG